MPLPLPPPLSVPLCTLLYESFYLSIHISEEPYFLSKANYDIANILYYIGVFGKSQVEENLK